MTAAPPRSLRVIVAGLLALAVVAVGCTAEPTADDDMESPASAPDMDDSDDAEDDAPDDTPDPSTPDTPPAPTEPAAQPPAEPAAKPPAAKPAAEPAAKPSAEPAAKPAVIADGEHAGRLVSITTTDVTVKLVRILSGDEAVAAAKADGGKSLDDDGTLPNDVYIQDLDRAVTIPVAGDGGFRIYDCSAGCEIVGTTLTALASGEAIPYGGPNAVIDLTVEQGVVVSFQEHYLP